MAHTLDVQGRWWLPDQEDYKVFGTFRWDSSSGGDLVLQGELRPVVIKQNVLADGNLQEYRDEPTSTPKQYAVIRGQVGREAFTLLDSFRRTVRSFDLDETEEHVRVNRVLQGAWFDYPEDLDVDRVIVDLRHLTGWIDPKGFTTSHPHDGTDGATFSVITATRLPPLVVQYGDTDVRFFQSLSERGDHVHELGIEQRWSLRVAKDDPAPLEPFIDTAADVQALVTIAVGESADFDKVSIQHPLLPVQSMAGTPIGNWRQDVVYHARWTNRSEPTDPVPSHDMFFTLEDLGGIDGVGRWLAVAQRYRTELSRVMATRYSTGMYLEDKIMNRAAVLESFDSVRRATGDQTVHYVDRVKQCVQFAGEPFIRMIDGDIDEWAKTVRNARHDLAHHRPAFRATGGAGDHVLAEQLFWLVAMCLLRLADAPGAVFDSISEHGQIRWLTEQARARRKSRRRASRLTGRDV